MNSEDALYALKEVRQRREAILREKLYYEKQYWQEAYDRDKYFLEEKIIRELCEEAQDYHNLGKDLKVKISLNATRFSGYNYVNVSQLLNKMRLAGIQIGIERSYDHKGTDIIAEVKSENIFRTNFMRSNLNFSFNELDDLVERGSEDWFVTCLSEYLNYKSNDKGREETESEMALAYYDKLTDDWVTCGALNDELKAFSPVGKTSYLSPKQELDENFGSFDNVLSKLEVLLSETGFEMYLNQNSHYEKGVNFQICMREKDYILDSTTGQTKLLQKTLV